MTAQFLIKNPFFLCLKIPATYDAIKNRRRLNENLMEFMLIRTVDLKIKPTNNEKFSI